MYVCMYVRRYVMYVIDETHVMYVMYAMYAVYVLHVMYDMHRTVV